MSQPPPPNPYGTPSPYPPPMGGYPPPVGGYPPPGYPQQGYGGPQRTSGTAIASLVLGILGICPVALIGGLAATILGILGIRATGRPNVKGRGMAIAGLVLGILGLIGWTVYLGVAGSMVWVMFSGRGNPLLARSFFTMLDQGNVQKAQAMCAPGTSAADLQATAAQMQGWGPLTDMSTTTTSQVNTKTTIDGTLQFQTGGSHPFEIVFDKTGGSPMPQVQSWEVK